MKKIAVINSDPDFRQLVKSFLERKGYVAVTLNVDEPVVPRLREQQPDVVILDINAEKEARLCEQLRRDEHIQHAKVVVLIENDQDTLSCEPDEVLLKPFAPQDLLAKIAGLV